MFADAKKSLAEAYGKRRIAGDSERRSEGTGKWWRNGEEEDVIPRLLEDDARAHEDDSRIRCYPGRRARREMHFPGFI